MIFKGMSIFSWNTPHKLERKKYCPAAPKRAILQIQKKKLNPLNGFFSFSERV